MIKLPKQARIWTVLILLTGGMGLSAMAQSAPPEDWTVSAQTTAAQCESDGTITLSNQNADALHNFTYFYSNMLLKTKIFRFKQVTSSPAIFLKQPYKHLSSYRDLYGVKRSSRPFQP